MPQFFRKNGMSGMQQPKSRFKDGENVAPRGPSGIVVVGVQPRLAPFDVPIAEISPEEMINFVCGFVKAKFVQSVIHSRDDPRETREIQRSISGNSLAGFVRRSGARCGGREIVERISARFKLF